MEILFAGDISFDWMPKPKLWQLPMGWGGESPPVPAGVRPVSGLQRLRRRASSALIGRRLQEALGDVRESADYFCVNLECALSDRGNPLIGKKYTLRAAPEYVATLRLAGVTHACLANNHVLDFGPEALSDTCHYLRRANIGSLGLSGQGPEFSGPTVLQRGQNRVSLLNYLEPALIDPDPDCFLRHDPAPMPIDEARMIEDIGAARQNRAAAVVILHWGNEWSFLESVGQRKLARKLIDRGAALVVGHHTHLAGGIEPYGSGLIAYGLGNLFMMLPGFSTTRAADRLMIKASFKEDRLEDYELIPLSNDARLYPVVDREVRLDSLGTDYLPADLTAHGQPVFDSVRSLSQATVTFQGDEGRVGSEWAEKYLTASGVVEGKLPLGPGWRVLDAGWTGLALSRERAAREYQSINLMHSDRAGTLAVEFDLPAGINHLYAVLGLPEYLGIDDLFECSPVTITSIGGELARFDPSGGLTGWLYQELNLALIGTGGKVTISMTAQNDCPAVGCVRLIGFK
jgi:hypothetical protein